MLVQTYSSATMFDFNGFFRMIINILLIVGIFSLVLINSAFIVALLYTLIKAVLIIAGFVILAKSVKWVGDLM